MKEKHDPVGAHVVSSGELQHLVPVASRPLVRLDQL
jgi:hypothetical protein